MMLEFICSVILAAFVASINCAPFDEGTEQCPDIQPQQHLTLQQIAGSWRLAYLFLGQHEEGINEDETCFVLEIIAANQSVVLSMFVDAYAGNRIERTTASFPVTLISPAEWKVYMPLSDKEHLHARVIKASEEHLVVTFCGPNHDVDDDFLGEGKGTSDDDVLDWRSLFETASRKRRKRRVFSKERDGPHMWTAVLVKHNDISALKFVEYAAVLMKHGFDVTQGELISFGKCPPPEHRQQMKK